MYSVGHQYDPLFSSRCASILSYHDCIVTDHISTPSFICAALGKKLLFLDDELIPSEKLINENDRVDRIERDKRRNADISLFNRVRDLPAQRAKIILSGYIESENTHKVNKSTLLDLINSRLENSHDLAQKTRCMTQSSFLTRTITIYKNKPI